MSTPLRVITLNANELLNKHGKNGYNMTSLSSVINYAKVASPGIIGI